MKYLLLILAFALANSQVIQLPPPKKEGGLPLYEALTLRQSQRDFHADESGDLTLEELSQLLWACYGINRPDNKYKTVPSSEAYFPFDVYVFMKTGVYLYDPVKHDLTLYKSEDLRKDTGGDAWVKDAYVNIVLYGVYSRVGIPQVEIKREDMEYDAGYPMQNMYMVAAAEGFKACVRANIDPRHLLDIMDFSIDDYYPTLAFSAGR